jgi:uncharacterized protein
LRITYDRAKREKTLRERGLDFADALEVFEGGTVNFADDRRDYGELRMITYGLLRDRMMAVVWTGDDAERRIISMRKANAREQKTFGHRLR